MINLNDSNASARTKLLAFLRTHLTAQSEPGKGSAWPAEIDGVFASHCLTLEVDVTQQFVGRVPGGYRIDLYYTGERTESRSPIVVPPESTLREPLTAYLQQASILSGNDWVTFTSEAVLDFDSRITIALKDSKTGASCPVAGRLRGRAHLRDLKTKPGNDVFPKEREVTPAEIFAVWSSGFEEDSYLPLILAASFDVPQQGFDEAQTTVYKNSRDLSSKLFLGLGTATYRKAPYGAVKRIGVELYTIEMGSVRPVATVPIKPAAPAKAAHASADDKAAALPPPSVAVGATGA